MRERGRLFGRLWQYHSFLCSSSGDTTIDVLHEPQGSDLYICSWRFVSRHFRATHHISHLKQDYNIHQFDELLLYQFYTQGHIRMDCTAIAGGIRCCQQIEPHPTTSRATGVQPVWKTKGEQWQLDLANEYDTLRDLVKANSASNLGSCCKHPEVVFYVAELSDLCLLQIENDFLPLFNSAQGLGTTTWSPLASGTLKHRPSLAFKPEQSLDKKIGRDFLFYSNVKQVEQSFEGNFAWWRMCMLCNYVECISRQMPQSQWPSTVWQIKGTPLQGCWPASTARTMSQRAADLHWRNTRSVVKLRPFIWKVLIGCESSAQVPKTHTL